MRIIGAVLAIAIGIALLTLNARFGRMNARNMKNRTGSSDDKHFILGRLVAVIVGLAFVGNGIYQFLR